MGCAAALCERQNRTHTGYLQAPRCVASDGVTAVLGLMARADHAMYEAKAAGRNGFRFSSAKDVQTNTTPL